MMLRYAILALALSTLSARADAPDRAPHQGHGLYHSYYQHWYNSRGTHCCDERDCRPTKDFRWQDGKWQVKLLDGTWYTVKRTDHVVDDGGLGPFGSVCERNGHVFCVDMPDFGT